MPNPPDGSIAQSELSRALAAHGPARIEGLVNLSQKRPNFAPVWVALAEEHLRARRTEEAVQAARRALRLEPTIHTSFSGDLAHVTDDLIVKRKEMKIPEELSASALEVTARPKKKLGRTTASKPGDSALREAQTLAGYKRREKLEELVVKYPENAHIWLALAEETLAQRSVEQAMKSVERATDLDPSLEAMLSPPLARAWKFHQVENRVASAQARASVPDGGGTRAPGPRVNRKPYARGAAASAAPEGSPDEPARGNPVLDKMLATAMGLRSRAERIKILKQLRGMDSNNIEVLFQLAKELAMGGHADEARQCGDELRKLSAERYTELYQWAAEYYANPQKARDEDRQKREANRRRAEPAAPARPDQPTVNRAPEASRPPEPQARRPARQTPGSAGPPARQGPAQGAIPSRKAPVPGSHNLSASRPPKAQAKHPSRSNVPAYVSPSASAPATPRAPDRRAAPARPSVSPLHDDDGSEATVQFAKVREYQEKRGRSASGAGPQPRERDYSQENQELKTTVMHLNQVQQLAGESRRIAAVSDQPESEPGRVPGGASESTDQAPLYLDDGESTEIGGRPPVHAASASPHPAEQPGRRGSTSYMDRQPTIQRRTEYHDDDDDDDVDTHVERREPTPEELEQHRRAQQQQQGGRQGRPQVPLAGRSQARPQGHARGPAGRPMPAEPIAAVSSPPPYSTSTVSRAVVQRRPSKHQAESHTQRAKLDELTLDRSTSMPPWLDSPRPWAASENGQAVPTSPNPHSAARTRNPGDASARRNKSTNAHPRLVRRPMPGRGPGSNDRS